MWPLPRRRAGLGLKRESGQPPLGGTPERPPPLYVPRPLHDESQPLALRPVRRSAPPPCRAYARVRRPAKKRQPSAAVLFGGRVLLCASKRSRQPFWLPRFLLPPQQAVLCSPPDRFFTPCRPMRLGRRRRPVHSKRPGKRYAFPAFFSAVLPRL